MSFALNAIEPLFQNRHDQQVLIQFLVQLCVCCDLCFELQNWKEVMGGVMMSDE